ncbi:MAG: winged helix-turn-helix domain-containing protein [Synechococcus sp.]
MNNQLPAVLLVGAQAVALAPRLAASGYQTVDWSTGAAACNPAPGAAVALAVVASDQSDLIPHLRAQFGSIPILLDVVADNIEGREVCLNAGANDFWLSNVGIRDLLQRLRLHLAIQQRNDQGQSLLRVADLYVDPSCRQVRRGNRAVALTTREYALLMLLFSRVGQVVARDQILAEIWSDERGSASNVIEVYVRYLRQKLEEGGEKRLIHTIRGRGYSLSDGVPSLTP